MKKPVKTAFVSAPLGGHCANRHTVGFHAGYCGI